MIVTYMTTLYVARTILGIARGFCSREVFACVSVHSTLHDDCSKERGLTTLRDMLGKPIACGNSTVH